MSRAPRALPEGVSESMSAEETQLLSDDRAAERAPQDSAPAAESAAAQPAPQASPEAASQPATAQPEAAAPGELTEEQKKANAVTQERERRKAAEKAQRETEQRMATLQGRLDVLAQLAQQSPQHQQAPAQPEIPDYNADPLGHLQARVAQAEQIAAAANERLAQYGQQTEQQINEQRLLEIASAQETDFIPQNPGYAEAAAWLRQSRAQELQFQGVPAHEIPGRLRAEIAQFTALALTRGMNFPEAVQQLANIRGYRAAPPAATPAPAPAPTTSAPEQQIQQIARGQEMTQSLGQVPGQPPPKTLTVEDLANMPEDEFAKLTQGDNWRKLWADAARS